jgi:excinuclease ABC subunit B
VTGSIERAMAETSRRREKQAAFNTSHGITPQSIKRNIADILGSVYEKDSLTVDVGDPLGFKRLGRPGKGVAEEGAPFIGHNLKAHIAELERQMREAAADLEFETAARLRDEIKRLQETELFIADDPLARQSEVKEAVAETAGTPKSSSRRGAYRGRRRKGP